MDLSISAICSMTAFSATEKFKYYKKHLKDYTLLQTRSNAVPIAHFGVRLNTLRIYHVFTQWKTKPDTQQFIAMMFFCQNLQNEVKRLFRKKIGMRSYLPQANLEHTNCLI